MLYRLPSKARTLADIAAADYLACYAKSFQIGETNLNGDGDFNFTELANRLYTMQNVCSYLVRKGLINVHMRVDGFTYTISEKGKTFCNQLTSEYASDFQAALDQVLVFEMDHPNVDLSDYVNQKGAASQRGETL